MAGSTTRRGARGRAHGAGSRAPAALAVALALGATTAACGGGAGEGGDPAGEGSAGAHGARAGGSAGGEGAEDGDAARGRDPSGAGSGGAGPSSGLPDRRDPSVTRARALFGEGLAAYEAGDLTTAAARLDEAYALVPTPELAFNVARVYERIGDAPKAIAHFRVYLERGQPSVAERADVERRIAALEAYAERQRQQIYAAPASTDELTAEARTFFLRGVAMFQRRAYTAAMEAFIAAYNFARLPEVIYNLAITAEKLERVQEAIDYYREFLRARPDDPSRAEIERKIAELRARPRR
jgi:tetratricopeptide (TPR) repeat protein